MLSESIFEAAVYPAITILPKLFTSACTKRFPIEIIDCCNIDGRAILPMDLNILKLNNLILLQESIFFILLNKNKTDKTAEIPSEIKVAIAAPLTPIFKFITNIRSKIIFISEEKIKKNKGVLESPKELNDELTILYINKNTTPIK